MASKYYYAVPWRERLLLIKLFAKWKGSVWQLLWIDLLLYTFLTAGISVFYRHLLMRDGYELWRVKFEEYIAYLKTLQNVVPLSFLLGFFVSLIVGRWWAVCMNIPWMSRTAILIPSYMSNEVENGEKDTRQIRLLILRYLNLSIAMQLRGVSQQLQKRFALKKRTILDQFNQEVTKVTKMITLNDQKKMSKFTIRDKLEVFNDDPEVKKTFGLLITPDEIKAFESIGKDQGSSYEPEYWVPLQWALRVVQKSRDLGYIKHDRHYVLMTTLIEDLRSLMQNLWLYCNFNVPLVYVQVVIIAVYSFVLGDLFAHQFIKPQVSGNSTLEFVAAVSSEQYPTLGKLDLYVPIFGILKFIFYVGWFKIGYALLNPLGEDTADFPVSDIFSYNLEASIRSGAAPDTLYPSFLAEKKEPDSFLYATKLDENLTTRQPDHIDDDSEDDAVVGDAYQPPSGDIEMMMPLPKSNRPAPV